MPDDQQPWAPRRGSRARDASWSPDVPSSPREGAAAAAAVAAAAAAAAAVSARLRASQEVLHVKDWPASHVIPPQPGMEMGQIPPSARAYYPPGTWSTRPEHLNIGSGQPNPGQNMTIPPQDMMKVPLSPGHATMGRPLAYVPPSIEAQQEQHGVRHAAGCPAAHPIPAVPVRNESRPGSRPGSRAASRPTSRATSRPASRSASRSGSRSASRSGHRSGYSSPGSDLR